MKAILFDLDGTLTDPREGITRSIAYALERMGVAPSLAQLRSRGATLLVATSKPQVYAERIVRHFGLDAYFDAVHGCELDGRREDKRDLLAHLLPAHGLSAPEAVMVGDRGADMAAARHHGARGIGVLWGYGSREELEGAGAHDTCDAPSALPEALG